MLICFHALTKSMDPKLMGNIYHSLKDFTIGTMMVIKVHQKLHIKLNKVYIIMAENIEG